MRLGCADRGRPPAAASDAALPMLTSRIGKGGVSAAECSPRTSSRGAHRTGLRRGCAEACAAPSAAHASASRCNGLPRAGAGARL